VTKLAPHRALKLIACGKLTFDERVVAFECFSAGADPAVPQDMTLKLDFNLRILVFLVIYDSG